MTKHLIAAVICACSALSPQATTIILGGNVNGNIQSALTTLGESYTLDAAMTPDPGLHSLGAGDFIITSNDGGDEPFLDYTSFLNAGGHVIVVGGSNLNAYRDWAALYFNLTDTGSGWHTDGDWHTTAATSSSAYIPANYTFENSNSTYHMLGFLAGTDTVLYGQNDEPVSIAAFRSYANGGSIDYMALDLGVPGYSSANDLADFTIPWLRGALEASAIAPVPEAASGLALLGFSLFGLAFYRRK